MTPRITPEQHAERDTALARIAELEQSERDSVEIVGKLSACIAELEKRCAAYERGAAEWLETRACIGHEPPTALARAESAEKLAAERGQNNRVLEADNADQIDRRRSAESRLAYATALLERLDDELITDPSDDPVTLQLDHDLGVFLGRLSATPAQAAEQSECHPAYCKHPFPWPNPDTTFDELKAAYESNTVALRDCRAELELAKELLGAKHPRYREYWAQLESARAERDTALSDIFDYLVNIARLEEENERWAGELHDEAGKREDLHKRLDTALARIAELEADRHEYVVKLDALREQIHAQAVAGREDGKLIAELKRDSQRSDTLRVAEVGSLRTRIAELEERELPAMKLVAKAYHDAEDAAEACIAELEAEVDALNQRIGGLT